MVLCVMCYVLCVMRFRNTTVMLMWQKWCSDVKGAAECFYVLCVMCYAAVVLMWQERRSDSKGAVDRAMCYVLCAMCYRGHTAPHN